MLFLITICLGFAFKANAQYVTGVLTGADYGRPIPGANIQSKGTNIGTITDTKGAYSISVPDANSVYWLSLI